MSRVAKFAVFTTIVLMIAGFVSAQKAPCEPKVDISSLLTNVDVDGSLRIGKLYARCLPMPTKVGRTNYKYHPYDGGKFTSTLKSANGKTVNTYAWYIENLQDLWTLSHYEIVGGPQALQTLTPGSYVIEFAIEDKVFQKFPFSVTTKQSADQFRPETLYLVDGLWSSYAAIYAPGVDRFFQLMVWLRGDEKAPDAKRTPVSYKLRLIRESDKKVLGESENGQLNLNYKWSDLKLSFRRAGAAQAKDYSEFKLSEITAVDGDYRIELAIEGRPVSNYSFKVKNGKINDLDLVQIRKENYRIIIPLSNDKPLTFKLSPMKG